MSDEGVAEALLGLEHEAPGVLGLLATAGGLVVVVVDLLVGADVLELPELVEEQVVCPLGPTRRRVYGVSTIVENDIHVLRRGAGINRSSLDFWLGLTSAHSTANLTCSPSSS